MAATGFTPIILFNSTTSGNTPTTSNLAVGELALNVPDGKLYFNQSGTIKVLANAADNVIPIPVTSGGTGITSLTANYIPYGNGTSAFQSSSNLQFNGTTLAITGAITATADSAFTSTGALQLPSGTTAQQPTGVAGKLRFNTSTSQFEGYNGTTWASVGGATISNDIASATAYYPLFSRVTTGTATTVYTSNAELLYTPSTGTLSSSVVNASNGIHTNALAIATSYTIPTGQSGMSAGPITINSGVTVTVSSGSRWVVL
jgi:hypothetical protein